MTTSHSSDKTAMKRPTINDPEIIRAAAEKILPKVMQWLPDYEPEESVLHDLCHAMKWGRDDGYAMTKRLDDKGWSPDSELVDIMNDAGFELSSVLEKAEREWVIETGAIPVPVNSRVTWNGRLKEGIGVVTRNDDCGKSYVHFPIQKEGACYIIPWEKLTVSETHPDAGTNL
jgi:hypothetical protein